MDEEANTVIDALGGTVEVARKCECNPQAVSQWRRKGLPPARRLFFKAIRPDLFEMPKVEAATSEVEAG